MARALLFLPVNDRGSWMYPTINSLRVKNSLPSLEGTASANSDVVNRQLKSHRGSSEDFTEGGGILNEVSK